LRRLECELALATEGARPTCPGFRLSFASERQKHLERDRENSDNAMADW